MPAFSNTPAAARIAAALVCLAALAGCAAKPAPEGSPAAGGSGAAGAAADEFTRLRSDYGGREDFFEICERGRSERLQQVSQLAKAGEWEQVLAVSEPWVQACPVDITARYVSAATLMELGREEEAQEHVRWYRGLIDSVLASGDGRTAETAFVVISVSEEYAVLNALRLQPSAQVVRKGGIDAFTVESPMGSGTIYFDPAAHLRRLQHGSP